MQRRTVVGVSITAFLVGCGASPRSPNEAHAGQRAASPRWRQYSTNVRLTLTGFGDVIVAAKPEKKPIVDTVVKRVGEIDAAIQTEDLDNAKYWSEYFTLAEIIVDLLGLIPNAAQYVLAIKFLIALIESVRVAYNVEGPYLRPAPPPAAPPPPGGSGRFPVPIPLPPARPALSPFDQATKDVLIELNGDRTKALNKSEYANQQLQRLLETNLKQNP